MLEPLGLAEGVLLIESKLLAWLIGQYLCPLLQHDTLEPGETIKVRGLWYGGEGAPGQYTVVVNQAFAFQLTVE
ncbi:MAG TPA: hypothetical protein VMD59_12540 [Acidimicrobiales bacterium]|nr:hypothetical protein [Acidimicrobiales bacterium]